MNVEKLEEKVYYYTDIIEDPKKLLDAIGQHESNNWDEWTACSGEHYVYGNETMIFSSESKGIKNEDNAYIYETLNNAFDKVARDYAIAQGISEEPNLFKYFPIKKYKPGTSMGAHFDQQEGDGRLKVSFVMYLNDDYEGGELSFTIASPDGPIYHGGPDPDFEIATKEKSYTFAIKPKAGSIIVFPPSPPYHHTAHLLKSGNKYMIPQHWIH
jgi:hypothetical protein